MAERFSVSRDSELYHGDFSTLDEAVAEGIEFYGDGTLWVGVCVSPPDPAQYFDAKTYFEHVSEQDEFSGEWAEDWLVSTREQDRELEAEVSAVIGRWLDRHSLRPKFWNIGETFKFEIVSGVANRL